jgi:hypothetical protein
VSAVDVERSPFVMPPVPDNFRVTEEGLVVPLEAPPPQPDYLGGYIKSFSASSLRLLRVCPEAYRQRYILGRKERPGGALTLGSAVHDALAFSHADKVTSGVDKPVPEVVEYFHDKSWPKAVESDGGLDVIKWDDGVKPDDYRRDGERMAQAYHHTVSPRIQPVERPEQRFDLYVDGIPVPFIGYLDFVEQEDVIDLKTGKQVSRKPDANWRMQGAIYTLVKQKPTHFHSLSRAKTPSIATPLTDPDMAIPYRHDIAEVTRGVLRAYKEQVEWFMNRHGPDEAWPTNGLFMDYKGGPACRYCGFRSTCPAWAWERSIANEGSVST